MYRMVQQGGLLEAVLQVQAPFRAHLATCHDTDNPHGWTCTLPKEHTGFHVAHGSYEPRLQGNRPIAMWDAS